MSFETINSQMNMATQQMQEIKKIQDLLRSLGFTIGDSDTYTDGTEVTSYYKNGIEIDISVEEAK